MCASTPDISPIRQNERTNRTADALGRYVQIPPARCLARGDQWEICYNDRDILLILLIVAHDHRLDVGWSDGSGYKDDSEARFFSHAHNVLILPVTQ